MARRFQLAGGALLLALSACAESPEGAVPDGTSAGDVTDSAGPGDAGVSDGASPVDGASIDDAAASTDDASTDDAASSDTDGPGPADLCAAWDQPLAEANLVSLRRFALRHATAIVTGTFGKRAPTTDGARAPFTVDGVIRGWRFLTGVTAMVPLPAGLDVSTDARWVVALTDSHPVPWDSLLIPYWGNALAVFPMAALDALDSPAVALRPGAMVAVVTISAQNESRTTFTVEDALLGEFPPSFMDNWYDDWDLPYPAPGPDRWIATVYGITAYPPGGDMIGSIVDLRPATEDALAAVNAAILAVEPISESERRRALRADWAQSYRFHTSPVVVSSVVTGLAGECCTNAGGTYVAHQTQKTLRGATQDSFVIGGHGYYGAETCGDGFVMGLSGMTALAGVLDEPFDCKGYPDQQSWNAMGPTIESPVLVSAPIERLEDVERWVSASHPLLALHAPGESVPTSALDQDSSNAPWSFPVDAADAFTIATHIALVTIDSVEEDPSTGVHTVSLTTTFSLYEYAHLVKYPARLTFRCGDPRWLEEGRRWIVPILMLDPVAWGASSPPDLSRAFVVPGAAVPESAITDSLVNLLATP